MPEMGACTESERTQKTITTLQRSLTHYTAGITGNLEVAREVVQEAFVRFWKANDRDIAVGEEKPWLLRVCRNLAIDHLRKSKRHLSVDSFDEGAVPYTYVVNGSGDADRELQQQVLSLLPQLSRDQQELVRLRFQHELSYKDIASVTGHSVSNVGVVLHEAMKKLRVLMQASNLDAKGGGHE